MVCGAHQQRFAHTDSSLLVNRKILNWERAELLLPNYPCRAGVPLSSQIGHWVGNLTHSPHPPTPEHPGSLTASLGTIIRRFQININNLHTFLLIPFSLGLYLSFFTFAFFLNETEVDLRFTCVSCSCVL